MNDDQLEHVPALSVWPFVIGLSLSLALFGIVTSLLFTAAGVIGVAAGIAGWIHDLRREARDAD